MGISEIIHKLVDNSHAFTPEETVQAHKDISENFGDDELYHMVPTPEAEAATADEKAQRRADLEAQLKELDADDPSKTDPPAA
jgi:hypothetical protein